MITLAIAELLHALAPQLKGWFGGESGVSSMRMPAWGFDFGSTTQVYYLSLAWVLISLAALYFHSRTPLGRLTLALRENPHRLRFLGYDMHGLGVSAFALSAMFSGIAGALQVISNESANYAVFDAGVSASVVLNCFIGGVGSFLGPALGAALMTFFGYSVSDQTQVWLLYQGMLFVLVMMYMPDGLTGLVSATASLVRRHGFARVLPLALLWVAAAVLVAAGVVFGVEMLQRLFSQDYRALARLDVPAHRPLHCSGATGRPRPCPPGSCRPVCSPLADCSDGVPRDGLRALSPASATDDEKHASSPESTPVLGLSEQVRA